MYGADLGFLALSLTSLKAEFHLTGVQAGTLGSLDTIWFGRGWPYWWVGLATVLVGSALLFSLLLFLRY